MKIRNFEVTLTGGWDDIPIESSYIAIQVRNPDSNDLVQYRFGADDTALEIAPGEFYELITPEIRNESIVHELQLKGTVGQKIQGERWLYNYQEIASG